MCVKYNESSIWLKGMNNLTIIFMTILPLAKLPTKDWYEEVPVAG